MSDKPDLFIITSAILTSVGSIDADTRFLQTLATVNSIIAYNPKSVIIIADGSLRPLEEYMIAELQHRSVLVGYSNDLNVLDIHKRSVGYAEKCTDRYTAGNSRHDTILHIGAGYIKNASETYLLLNVLDKINASDFNRIFKISGRYVLGSGFNRADHTGNVTTKKSEKTNQMFELVKTDRLVNCILWSFDPAYIHEVKEGLHKIAEWIDSSFSSGVPGPDLEHGIHRFLKDRTEIKSLGILGAVNVPNSKSRFVKA